MKLEEIQLDNIRELISNKAYNVLIDNNILTVGDVMNFSVSSFAAVGGVGPGKVKDYEQFKYKLKETPAVIMKCYEETLPRKIPENISDIAIECLENLMHKHVFNLLINNAYEKVGDLTDLSVEKFKKLKSSGKIKAERYANFYDIIFKKPELIMQTYQDSLPQIIPSESNDINFLRSFKCFFDECYSLRIKNADNERKISDVIRAKIIIEKFYCLEPNLDHPVGEIELSALLGISSARIGMIRNEELKYFRNLINDSVSTDKKIILEEGFVNKLHLIKERLNKRVYSLEKMHAVLKNSFFEFNDSEFKVTCHVKFLLLMFGFYYETSSQILMREESVYIRLENNIDSFRRRYFTICLAVFNYLRDTVLSVDINKLFVDINQQNECSMDELILVCENSSFIEILNNGDELSYQMKFSRLSSAADKAFRVLSERDVKAVPIEEIVAIINTKLVNQDNPVNKVSLSAAMSGTGRFKSVAKTGLWALKNWDINTDTMDDLLLNCFRKEERDLSVDEIHDIILNVYRREDVQVQSIKDYLASEKYFSIGDRDCRTFISYEYKHRYEKKLNNKSKNVIDYSAVVSIVNRNPDSSVSELLILCSEENLDLHENSLREYLKNKWIIKNEGMPLRYTLKENYKELISRDIEEKVKMKDVIKKSILEKLNNVDRIALNKLVVFCEMAFNKKPPYVYGLIDEMEKELSINKLDIDKKLFVSIF